MKTRRRCAPPFFCYPRKTRGGGRSNAPPPAGRGLKGQNPAMKVTDPISSPSQHVVQTKNPRMENLRNQKWETSYKKATSTCHFILRQIRSHSLCFPRHECRIWVLWNWVACFPCPRCIFIRRNFRTGNFNTNRSIITGDVKYGIKIPNVSCFLFIILASDLCFCFIRLRYTFIVQSNGFRFEKWPKNMRHTTMCIHFSNLTFGDLTLTWHIKFIALAS